MIRALLPLKNLAAAKTRLSGVLSASERRALALAMAEDVLAVLVAHPLVAEVTLVSDDAVAHLLAAGYGARHLDESAFACTGLNAVLERAADRIAPGPGDGLLLVHADLPLLDGGDIDAAIAAHRARGGLVIGTDRAGRGTNLLLFGEGVRPPFQFGCNSRPAHQRWARHRGLAATVLRRPGVALDIDLPADLALLLRSDRGRRTGALLDAWPVARIETALGSIRPAAPLAGRGLS